MDVASQHGYASATGNTPRTTTSNAGGGGGASTLTSPSRGSVMELEHAIGTSGLPSSVHVVPGTSTFLSIGGGCLIRSDLRDPHAQEFLRGHDNAITKLSLSDDGTLAVTGQRGPNADVCIWQLGHQGGGDGGASLLRRLCGHEGSVLALALSPDNSMVVSVGEEKRLTFVDVSNGGVITHTPLNAVVPATDAYQALVFGPRVQDNKRRNTNLSHVALITSTQLLMYQLDPFHGQLHAKVVNLTSFQRRFTVGRYATNGDLFLLGTEAGDVAIIDTVHGTVSSTVRVCSGGVRDMLVLGSTHHNDAMVVADPSGGDQPAFRYAKFGPGSQRRTVFFVSGGDGSVSQVDIADHVSPQGRVVSKKVVGGGHEPAQSLSVVTTPPAGGTAASTATVLLVGVASGSLYLVDMSNAAASFSNAYTQVPDNHGVSVVCDSVAAAFTVVAPHPSDPERFYTASLDGYLRAWDLSSYRQQQVFPMEGKSVTALSCSAISIADGLELMLSSWSDGAIRCHDLAHTTLLWAHAKAHRCAVTALTLSPSLKYFVSGSNEGEIKVWDIRSRQVKLELKDHNQAIVHLQLFDDDKHLLSASKDRTICTWDLTTGRRVTSHEAHSGPITSALLSRNQSEVYTVAHDHRIHVHDIRHREAVRAAAYCAPQSEAVATKIRRSADERMLVTGGTDQLVKLWEPRTLRCVTTGYAHSGTVADVGFTCDNRQVLSCGHEGSTMIWNVYA